MYGSRLVSFQYFSQFPDQIGIAAAFLYASTLVEEGELRDLCLHYAPRKKPVILERIAGISRSFAES